jgi:hypothetical protein
MNDATLERLRTIVRDKAAEMGWKPDDVLALAASAFANGNPILDTNRLKPFRQYEALTGKRAEDVIHEALDDYAECCLPVLVEELAARTKLA